MRIAIVGVGAIGSTFAFQLVRTGKHEVAVIARPGSVRLRQVERDNAIVNERGDRADVSVFDTLDERVPYDLVVVTLLAHRIDAVLPALQRSAARCIAFMCNTFEPERLQDALGVERCTFGMPFVQAMLDGNGRVASTIGRGGQKSKLGRQRWVDCFVAAGLPAVLEPRMPLWLRCHAPLCVAFQSVSVAGMRRDGGASWRECLVVARGMHEGFALVAGLGYPIYPSGKVRLTNSPAPLVAAMLWLLSRVKPFRTLLATGEAECAALVEVMAAAASRSKTPIAVANIRAMDPSALP